MIKTQDFVNEIHKQVNKIYQTEKEKFNEYLEKQVSKIIVFLNHQKTLCVLRAQILFPLSLTLLMNFSENQYFQWFGVGALGQKNGISINLRFMITKTWFRLLQTNCLDQGVP